MISIEKTVKAVVLIIVGFKLLSLVNQDVHTWASDFVTRHGIDIGNRFVHAALERLVGITSSQIVTFSVVAFFYSSVLLVEAIGLWLQKRWAEYLTVIVTASFLPLEIYEMIHRSSVTKGVVIVANFAIFVCRGHRHPPVLSHTLRPDGQIPAVVFRIGRNRVCYELVLQFCVPKILDF